MTIWVKEYKELLTIDALSLWIRDGLLIKQFVNFKDIGTEDVLIVSKSDLDIQHDIIYKYNVLIYEGVLNDIANNIIEEIKYNYDYYYLKNAIDYAKNEYVDTIITGSSYGLFGIDSNMLKREVNLSLASQDIYYSIKGIHKVLESNKNIRNIVICCGYYYFYSDLSRARNEFEIARVAKVYNKLYGDMHNASVLPPVKNILFESRIFDIKKATELLSIDMYENGYFSIDRPRKLFATKEWEDKIKEWSMLSEDEKDSAGKSRAMLHNKALNREASLGENIELINNLSIFCNNNGINLSFVVTPVSKYYKKYLDMRYEESFFSILNEIKGTINLLDLADCCDIFLDDIHFNDTDHLNDTGATKFTQIILDMLHGMK